MRNITRKYVNGDDHEHDSQRADCGARRSYSWASGLAATLKRWRAAYITWRIEQAAIVQLWSMSDRELKDIGLTRSEITSNVRIDAVRDRAFSMSVHLP